MAAPLDWTCPFCQKPVLIDPGNSRKVATIDTAHEYSSGLDAAEGQMSLYVVFTTCPDRKCRRTALAVHLYPLKQVAESGVSGTPRKKWVLAAESPTRSWSLIPSSTAKLFPDYIPAPIREDYEEAARSAT